MLNLQPLITVLERLVNVKPVAENSSDTTIVENANKLVETNVQQMLHGLDSEGNFFGSYTPYSKAVRREAQLQTEYIDLRFTGAFQDSIKLTRSKQNEFMFKATDWKWEAKLKPQERFQDALGIQEDSQEYLKIMIIDNMTDDIYDYLAK